MPDLSDVDLAMLALERKWWQRPGGKDQAVADLFGITAARYFQRLNVLINQPEALAADPVTVNRLRRLRAERAAVRSGRRSA